MIVIHRGNYQSGGGDTFTHQIKFQLILTVHQFCVTGGQYININIESLISEMHVFVLVRKAIFISECCDLYLSKYASLCITQTGHIHFNGNYNMCKRNVYYLSTAGQLENAGQTPQTFTCSEDKTCCFAV